ncbi:hypothetical protein [Streptomyces sp. NPDC088554]|uniref:hypothetical protein n=1 Tax=Streptomyces sp. NPDC088554 TaxID=3365865 RepID=UPI00382951B5
MPSPPDDATAERMRTALQRATQAFPVAVDGSEETWGWDGRSLSTAVAGGRWLRLSALPEDKAAEASWDGPEVAQKVLSNRVPRPRLHLVHTWLAAGYAYRAEVYDRLQSPPLSRTALPPADLQLPDAWWTSLSDALAAVKEVRTDRVAIRQQRLHWALPRFLEVDINTEVPEWNTAHADIQWSNLVGPELSILDWERWGLAPTGYDEATLYISSLAAPEVAKQVWRTFEPVLSSPAGRFSQLVVASEFVQGMGRGNNMGLKEPLQKQIARLLR